MDVLEKEALKAFAWYKAHREAETSQALAQFMTVYSDTHGERTMVFPHSDILKDDVVLAMRMALAWMHADAVLFLTDTWIAEVTPVEALTAHRHTPSQHPKRQDALMCSLITRTTRRTWVQIYKRVDGAMQWADWTLPPNADFTGRMAEWLEPVGPKEITFTQRRKLEPVARQLFNTLMRKPPRSKG